MKKLITLTLLFILTSPFIFAQQDTVLKVDATSIETIKSSALKIKAQIPEDEYRTFSKSFFKIVIFYEQKYGKGDASFPYIKEALNNKTPEEINAFYKVLSYDQAKIDVKKYYEAQKEIEPDLKKLAQLKVLSYTFDSITFGDKTYPITHLTLKNEFNDTISYVEFFTKVYGPDGDIIDEIHVYTTEIDINPNETKEVNIRYSHANKACYEITNADNSIDIEFIEFQDKKHNVLVDKSKYTKRDQEKFERLIKKYPELQE